MIQDFHDGVCALQRMRAVRMRPQERRETNVAVAANFTEPAKEIAALFKQKTGDEAILSFGATGAFFTQITHDAPFQVFLSADQDRPKAAVEGGLRGSRNLFTYAIGKLVLWSKVVDVTNGEAALKAGAFSKLSIANPAAAPYGAAAIETMKALGVYDALQPKIVQGNSIAQAFQFVDTKNAEVGFVALSQLYRVDRRNALDRSAGPLFADPPGRRAAEEGRERRGVEGVPRVPERSGGARDHREVRLRARLSRDGRCAPISGSRSPDARTRGDHDAVAARDRHAARLVARALARRWKEVVATIVSLPMVLPPTVLGFYLLIALGPSGPGGAIAACGAAARLPSPSGAS